MTSTTEDRIARLDSLLVSDDPNSDRLNKELSALLIAVCSGEVTHLSRDDVYDRIRTADARGLYVMRSLRACSGLLR